MTHNKAKCYRTRYECVSVCVICSGVSNSLQPQGLYPTRLLCPCKSPGKNTGVGSHFLLQGIFPTKRLNPGHLHCIITYRPNRWDRPGEQSRDHSWQIRTYAHLCHMQSIYLLFSENYLGFISLKQDQFLALYLAYSKCSINIY